MLGHAQPVKLASISVSIPVVASQVGIPLTTAQLEAVSLQGAVAALVASRQHTCRQHPHTVIPMLHFHTAPSCFWQVGIPLTMAQLDAVSLQGAVSALVAARHHLLAARACRQLGLDISQVRNHSQ